MDKKFRLNYIDVELDNKVNVDAKMSNRIIVNIVKADVDYIRKGEFVTFSEKMLLKNQLNLNFDTESTTDISQHVDYVDVVKSTNKYGEKLYLNVHFKFGYDKRIDIDNADYFLYAMSFDKTKVVNQPTKEIKK